MATGDRLPYHGGVAFLANERIAENDERACRRGHADPSVGLVEYCRDLSCENDGGGCRERRSNAVARK